MVKTIISAAIVLIAILSASFFETYYVNRTFEQLTQILLALHDKTEAQQATLEDGFAARRFWEEKKETLQIWLPHVAIQEVDYQLYEAVGFISVRDYQNALPKLEVVLGMCENIPQSYSFGLENIF